MPSVDSSEFSFIMARTKKGGLSRKQPGGVFLCAHASYAAVSENLEESGGLLLSMERMLIETFNRA